MLRDVYYGIPSTVYEGQLARGVFKGEVNGVVYYHFSDPEKNPAVKHFLRFSIISELHAA